MKLGLFLIGAGLAVAITAVSVPAHATSGWGCFGLSETSIPGAHDLKAGPSADAKTLATLDPNAHGIIAEDGPCKPLNTPPSKQWCPIKHYNGDKTDAGWLRLRHLRFSECP